MNLNGIVSRYHRPWIAPLFVASLLVAACSAPRDDLPAPEAPIEDATATPEPAIVGEPRIRALVEAECALNEVGAAVLVTYTVTGEGGRSVGRVRLYIDGALESDSGPIAVTNYERTRLFVTRAGSIHNLQLRTDSAGQPTILSRGSVRCPAVTSGPRA